MPPLQIKREEEEGEIRKKKGKAGEVKHGLRCKIRSNIRDSIKEKGTETRVVLTLRQSVKSAEDIQG